MQRSKLSIALALTLVGAGCGRQAAVTTASITDVASATAESSTVAPNPDTQCKSWGIQPGTPGYKQCVDGMNEAANAAAAAGDPPSAEQAQAEAANMRADLTHQRDDLRKQIEDQTKAAKSDPKCVTVTNGTNTSTSCP